MQSQTESNSALPSDPHSVGDTLRAAREAAGLSLGEVADRLKLSLKQLEAIESDRFDALPGAAFVRGFVRNYARFLGLDTAPLMAKLEERFPSSVKDVANLSGDVEAPVLASEPEGSSARLGKRAILLVLVVVLAAGAFWFARSGSGAARQEAKQELAPMMTEKSSASAPVEGEANTSASAPVAQPAAAPVATPAPAVAAPASAPAAAVPPSGTGKIKLVAKQDAWVSVVDGSGKKLVFETLKAGAAREVAGQPPFKLTVGNASQVDVSFNGRPVVISDKIRGTTARLELK